MAASNASSPASLSALATVPATPTTVQPARVRAAERSSAIIHSSSTIRMRMRRAGSLGSLYPPSLLLGRGVGSGPTLVEFLMCDERPCCGGGGCAPLRYESIASESAQALASTTDDAPQPSQSR